MLHNYKIQQRKEKLLYKVYNFNKNLILFVVFVHKKFTLQPRSSLL